MAASIASISTEPIGLKGEDIRRLDRDIRLLMVVVEEFLLNVEEGDEDLGVDISELELE
jgi:hypothetical protein